MLQDSAVSIGFNRLFLTRRCPKILFTALATCWVLPRADTRSEAMQARNRQVWAKIFAAKALPRKSNPNASIGEAPLPAHLFADRTENLLFGLKVQLDS